MNVPLIKIEKKTGGKVEQAKTIISIFCVLSDIHLSDSEKKVLAYFMVYGLTPETKNLILKSQILANENSLGNAMTKLRNVGFIKKVNKEDILNNTLSVALESVMGIFIKIDNR